jgi:two-component sensor histidine kinase
MPLIDTGPDGARRHKHNLSDIDTAGALRAVFELSQDCIKMLSPAGHLFFMNFNGLAAMEMDSLADHADIPWWDLWPAETKQQVIKSVDDAKAGLSSRFTAFRPTAKGSPRWWDVGVSPVYGASGEIESLLVINRDVTEEIRRKEEIEVMSAEMRHRLKNAFAVSAAIAKISASTHPHLQEFAQSLASRFTSLAMAQSRILESGGVMSLAYLVEELANTLNPNNDAQIVMSFDNIVLHESDVRILSMIFGELFTNAVKYGAIAKNGSLEISGVLSGKMLAITWIETVANNNPVDPGLTSGGAGLVLISRLLKISGGTIERREEAPSLQYRLSLPLRDH